MEFNEYIEVARRRWWVVLLVALAAMAGAFAASRLQTPVYKATAELFISPARTDFGLTQSAKQLIASYIGIIVNKRNAEEIRKRLALDYSADTIFGNTKVADDAARFAVTIEVKDYDGETANRIARAWSELFVEWRNAENAKQRREDRVDAVLGDYPVYHQDSPRATVNVAAGGVLGLLAGLFLVVALEWSQAGVLRTQADAERRLNLPVIGSIPEH
jgi:capsular polysaccharide biosynthesis protein